MCGELNELKQDEGTYGIFRVIYINTHEQSNPARIILNSFNKQFLLVIFAVTSLLSIDDSPPDGLLGRHHHHELRHLRLTNPRLRRRISIELQWRQ
jgi:hypothetical protein